MKITAVAGLALLLLASYVHSQSLDTKAKEKTAVSKATPAEQAAPVRTSTTESKPRRLLVARLPARVEGVELKNGAVWAKSGYQFVKQPNGSVALARISGGGGGANLRGTWSCLCAGNTNGPCDVKSYGTSVSCVKAPGSNCSDCMLTVSIDGSKLGVLMY